jgi:hypothetical protein
MLWRTITYAFTLVQNEAVIFMAVDTKRNKLCWCGTSAAVPLLQVTLEKKSSPTTSFAAVFGRFGARFFAVRHVERNLFDGRLRSRLALIDVIGFAGRGSGARATRAGAHARVAVAAGSGAAAGLGAIIDVHRFGFTTMVALVVLWAPEPVWLLP